MQDPNDLETGKSFKEEEENLLEKDLEIKIESNDPNQEELEKKQKAIRARIAKLLNETGLKVKWQTGQVAIGTLANDGTFAVFSYLAPGTWGARLISSIGGSLANFKAHKVAKSDKGNKAQSLLRVGYGMGLSEAVRSLGDLIAMSNETTGHILSIILPGLAQSAWFNNCSKDATAKARWDELQILINEEKNICDQLHKKSAVFAFSDDESENFDSRNPAPLRLQEIEDQIVELLDNSGVKCQWRAGAIAVGFMANAGLFTTLTYLTPSIGMLKGPLSVAAGVFANNTISKAMGIDKGPAVKTFFRSLDSIGISEGLRSLGQMINTPISAVLEIILPALAQSEWFGSAATDATASKNLEELKKLVTEYNEVCKKTKRNSRFDFVQEESKSLDLKT